jgi:hypothetical protein
MIINEIEIGVVSFLNGMTMYRKFDIRKGFQTVFDFTENEDGSYTMTENSYIVINYIQLYRNSDGDEVVSLREYKNYILGNAANYPVASGWYNTLSRTPVTLNTGIVDSIEYTIGILPLNIPNGYQLQPPTH